MSTRYLIQNPRFVPNSGKGLEKNPDKFGTMHGKFFNEKGEELSVPSKVITFDDVRNSDTVIDIENGVLVLPSGEKGRKPSKGSSQEDINSLLETVRNSAAE